MIRPFTTIVVVAFGIYVAIYVALFIYATRRVEIPSLRERAASAGSPKAEYMSSFYDLLMFGDLRRAKGGQQTQRFLRLLRIMSWGVWVLAIVGAVVGSLEEPVPL